MNLTIKDFSGPIDLLLHLVKTAKMDIYEIDTKLIIGEYLNFINGIDKKDLDNASEYLVMAAELIHLKSRILINSFDEDEESEFEINSEEDLKNKLLEYEKYKNICNEFREFESKRSDFYTKSPENLNEFKEKRELKSVSLDELVKAFNDLKIREEYKRPVNTRILTKELRVEDKIVHIEKMINVRGKVLFKDLFIDNTKPELVVTFLAILNMCKDQVINIYQDDNFSDIFVERTTNE